MIRKATLQSILVHDFDELMDNLHTEIDLGAPVDPVYFTRLHERLNSIDMTTKDHAWFKHVLRSIEKYYAVGELSTATYSIRFARKRLQSRI